MILAALFASFSLVLVTSCSQKMVCPAYQSAFLFDTTALKNKFSYFINDTPKIIEVNKNKFLLIEPVPYRKMMASFRTIEMLPIYPVIPDSLRLTGDAQMDAEKDIQDSLGVQKPPLHPGLIGTKFNVEQENYMYYFRKILVLPDVRGEAAEPVKLTFKEKLKKLFKRKKGKRVKKSERMAETSEPGTNAIDQPEEKKPFFSKFKRQKKSAEIDIDPNAPPPEQKEDDGGGTDENGNGG